MKTFELKSINRAALLMIALPTVFLLLIIGMFQLPWILTNGYEYAALGAALAIVFIVFITLKKLLTQKYTIYISEKEMVVAKANGNKKSVALNQIAKLTFKQTNQSYELTIFTSHKTDNLFAKFDVTLKQEAAIKGILGELKTLYPFSKSSGSNSRGEVWDIYLNMAVVQANAESVKYINTSEKKRKRKQKAIGILLFLAVMAVMIAPFFINPKAFYDNKEGKIYFGSKELVGVDPKETEVLSYHALKDSSHVYYKDQILEWADRETFQCIREPFYMDKNGLYYETSNFYSKNKIVPLKGDFDSKTFQPVDQYSSTFFKDKNSVYELDVLASGAPIKKIPEVDAGSFEMLNHFWYADKNTVYFSNNGLKQCVEIDRATFEVLSFEVAKDKSNVYFLTYNLKSDNQVKGEHKGYAILEGADAPTFKKLDDKRFVDKNTEWTITDGDEKEKPTKRRREDVR